MEMQTMRNRLPLSAMRLCIDDCRVYDVSGRLYSRLTGKQLDFCSMAELLLETDALLDEIGSPQAFQKKRIFSTGRPEETGSRRKRPVSGYEKAAEEQQGRCGTFELVVQSRMHASWQGFLKDDAGRMLGSFESELQLMELLLEALHQKAEAVAGENRQAENADIETGRQRTGA